MRRISIFLLLFLAWMLLAWPFDPQTGKLDAQSAVVGLGVALLVMVIMRNPVPAVSDVAFGPVRLWWFLVYVVVVSYYVVKANFDVAYRVLHPSMPIRPGIIKVKTGLKSLAGITVLANSITLTPGTLTVSVRENGDLYVHCINVRSTDIEEASHDVVGRFEWFLERIFE